MKLDFFNNSNLIKATHYFFSQLGIKLNTEDSFTNTPQVILKEYYKDNATFNKISEAHFVGYLDKDFFENQIQNNYTYDWLLDSNNNLYDGLLFFALKLNKYPNRSEISEITRAFNRKSKALPIILIFNYENENDSFISLSINERFKYLQNWRQGEKVGKTTVIRDINIKNPHAGHIRILNDLKLTPDIKTFNQLHQHWLKVFDVSILNKKFYQELANWYFAAINEVSFPDDLEKNYDIRNATNLIRLITRVIFIWFLKEKNLIPTKLFQEDFLEKILKDFNNNEKSHNYYNAILQNLFFGTLNQKMNERRFAKDADFNTNKEEYGVKNLYRYADLFTIPEKEILELFREVPFLNGGLFDCLDKADENGKIIYVDGFSRNPKKKAIIPDKLFFGKENEVDLNNIYGTKNKKYKTRGLIKILESYKFTIAENTPLDEEIALDPELLGKVFENLLASYNPETSTTARKATGSYYTPREIVDYMVKESIKEYFKTQIKDIDEKKLESLILYDDNPNPFDEDTTNKLINVIYNLKLIDPAVGSGAFPMGALHTLVHILRKLDPENKHWKEIQKEKIIGEEIKKLKQDKEIVSKLSDEQVRQKALNAVDERLQEIETIFNTQYNFDDYARKLYLIENCIYGIDIQPIAVQISKLRFFISLIIDQKVNKNEVNFGIRSLPNLETKFVAANTLIGLDKPLQAVIRNLEIEKKETELKEIRHKYFVANTRKEKLRLQQKDKKIRQEISKMLENDGWNITVAQQIVSFDPYDQNTSANWFDAEWMFGISDGFDIVIGNPPYVSTKGVESQFKKILENQYGFADDTYNHFYFKGIELLKDKGILAYISSKTFWTIQTKKNLRDLLLKNKLLLLFDTANPFESAMVDTCVTIVQKQSPDKEHSIIFLDGKNDLTQPEKYTIQQQIYANTPNNVFFAPTKYNLKIYERLGKKVNDLLKQWWDKISTSQNIEKHKRLLESYRNSLKPGDITLLGLITEGGQGLATANNGKFVGVLEGTKWAEKVKKERPEKLLLATEFCKKQGIKDKKDAQRFLDKLSEKEIRTLFDNLKAQYGRDIFGQGWLYRIVSKNEIADVETLTEDEKLNGIAGGRTFVPYDKGDKDGNRWYAPTPYYIDWSSENVKFLKENSGKKGEGMPVVRNPQFYFREGFCWNLINATRSSVDLKVRLVLNSVYDVGSMRLFSVIKTVSNSYIAAILNSKLENLFAELFINFTLNFQINDARQLPIIIPTSDELKVFESIFNRAYEIQKRKFAKEISETEAEEQLSIIQSEIDRLVYGLYELTEEEVKIIEGK